MLLSRYLRFGRNLRRIDNDLFNIRNVLFKFAGNDRFFSWEKAKNKKNDDNSLEVRFAKQLLTDSRIYKGLAFTPEERDMFSLKGVLPPAVKRLEQQLEQYKKILDATDETDLTRFIRVMALYDLNKKLFYKFVEQNFERILRILYTPYISGVAIDRTFIFGRPRCLYVTINDRGKVKQVLKNWPHKNIKLIIVSDGERVYALGDLGVNVAQVCVGKHVLYTAVAGTDPYSCLPVVIDVGTDNEIYLTDRFYYGLSQRRVRGKPYDDLIDEFMGSVREIFGPRTVIHMENFARDNCWKILRKYQNDFCCFNNDVQSIAAVIVSGVSNGAKIAKKKITEMKFVFFGAGPCNLGIGLLVKLMLTKHGLSEEQALENMYFIDKKGLIVKKRTWKPDDHKLIFARDLEPLPNLLSVVKKYKPDVLIGASTVFGGFSKEVLQSMAEHVECPLIFALSNPLQSSECTAEEAIQYTDGRCIFGSGYPYQPVVYKGKIYHAAHANTYYINTMAVATNLTGVKSITNDLLMKAAQVLSECVTKEELEAKIIYPPLWKIRQAATYIIVELMEYAYRNGLATVFPEPQNKKELYLSNMYQTNYPDINFYKNMFEKVKKST